MIYWQWYVITSILHQLVNVDAEYYLAKQMLLIQNSRNIERQDSAKSRFCVCRFALMLTLHQEPVI